MQTHALVVVKHSLEPDRARLISWVSVLFGEYSCNTTQSPRSQENTEVLLNCRSLFLSVPDWLSFLKHRKNCKCCPCHSLFKGHNVIVNIVVLNCQKCNQCLKCQVSGHKSSQSLFANSLSSLSSFS